VDLGNFLVFYVSINSREKNPWKDYFVHVCKAQCREKEDKVFYIYKRGDFLP